MLFPYENDVINILKSNSLFGRLSQTNMIFLFGKMPSELLDDSACDQTTDTTDNNPPDSFATSSQHIKSPYDDLLPSTLDILVELGGGKSATGAHNQHPSDMRLEEWTQ